MEGNLSKLIVAFMLGSGILMGVSYWMADMGNLYGFSSNSTVLQGISIIEPLNEEIGTAENTTSTSSLDVSSGLSSPYSGAWSAILNLLNLPSLMTGMVNEIGEEIGIPAWFLTLIISIILVISTFAIIKIFTGGTGV